MSDFYENEQEFGGTTKQAVVPLRPTDIEPLIVEPDSIMRSKNIFLLGEVSELRQFIQYMEPSSHFNKLPKKITLNVPIFFDFDDYGDADSSIQIVTFIIQTTESDMNEDLNNLVNDKKMDAIILVGNFHNEKMLKDLMVYWFQSLSYITIPFFEQPIMKILVNMANPELREKAINHLEQRFHFGFDMVIQNQDSASDNVYEEINQIRQALMTGLCSILDQHTNPLLSCLDDIDFDIGGIANRNKHNDKVNEILHSSKIKLSVAQQLFLLQATYTRVMQLKHDILGRGRTAAFSLFLHKQNGPQALTRTQYSWIDRLHDVFVMLVEKQLDEMQELRGLTNQSESILKEINSKGADVLFAVLQYTVLQKQTNRYQSRKLLTATMEKLVKKVLKQAFKIDSYGSFNPLIFYYGNNGQLSEPIIQLVLHPFHWIDEEANTNGYTQQLTILGDAFRYKQNRMVDIDHAKSVEQTQLLCDALDNCINEASNYLSSDVIEQELNQHCQEMLDHSKQTKVYSIYT